jgi:hypothetical protein
MIFLIDPAGPWTMSPSMSTSSPVPTGRRVETLPTNPGVAVGVARSSRSSSRSCGGCCRCGCRRGCRSRRWRLADMTIGIGIANYLSEIVGTGRGADISVLTGRRNAGGRKGPCFRLVKQGVAVAVPANKSGTEVVAEVRRCAFIIPDGYTLQRNVAGVCDDVSKHDGAAHRNGAPGRAVVICSVGQLEDINRRIGNTAAANGAIS